jgi:type IV pilus assembly protein PilV
MSKTNISPLKIFQRLKSLDERGFNLIELLIALTVFTIGIMAVAAMQTASARGNNLASSLSMGVRTFNQNKAEQLLSLAYGDTDLDAGTHPTETMTGSNNVVYSTFWTVVVNNPYTGAKTVTVSTSWSDYTGTHTVTTAFIKDSLIY